MIFTQMCICTKANVIVSDTVSIVLLAWPLHKDDMLFQSGRPTGLNIYFTLNFTYCSEHRQRFVTFFGTCHSTQAIVKYKNMKSLLNASTFFDYSAGL